MTTQVAGRRTLARLESALDRPTLPAWFFLVLVSAYLATAHYGGNVVNDVHSAAHAAWSLATRGTLDLSGLDLPYDQAWVVAVGDAEYSDRFPGVIAAAVPLYALVRPELPLVWPATVSAAVAAAIGVTALLIALRRLVPTGHAVVAASFLGCGTGVWAVAADGLWSHGITTMWVGLAFAGVVVGGRWRVLEAAAAAGAVLTRPHLGVSLVVAAAVLWRRDRAGAVALTAGAVTGGALFLLYGRVVFDQWSLTGGYSPTFLDPTHVGDLDRDQHPGLWRLLNLGVAAVAPKVGVLSTYPVLIPTVWAAVKVARRLPWPAVAWGAAAVVYAALQLAMVRVSGGSGFWGNRTLIEAVVLAWPLAAAAVAAHRGGRLWRGALAVTTAWTVGFHALGAVAPSPAASDSADLGSPWFWQVPWALDETEPWRLVVVGAAAIAAGAVAWVITRSAADMGASEPGEDPVAVQDGVGRPVDQPGESRGREQGVVERDEVSRP